MRMSFAAVTIAFGLFSLPAWAQPAPNIGVAATVVDKMEGTVSTNKRVIGRGDKVYKDEVVETAERGKGQLLFLDETTLTVGPNSRVTLDRFVYDPSRSTGTVTMTAARGVFRFVSGSLPSQAYEIKTPAGSIGVRGTIFELICEADGTVIVRLLEGGIVFTTLARQQVALTRPGQVLVIRPNGTTTINNGLTDRQTALLQPIVDFGAGAVTPGQDRRDQLRDQLRGGGGGQGSPPPSD
ncbi:MAG: hypothetical protein K0S54_2330 [Alphaproteobacteria bacterium]|jgi:hypothetical protein|nr:hypothetical protein [Alphaproteobacteria bacterium]